MKNHHLFIVLAFLSILFGEMTKYFLNIKSLILDGLTEQLAYEIIDDTFDKIRRWQLLGYLIIPFFLLAKTQIIAGILGIGTFFLIKTFLTKNYGE